MMSDDLTCDGFLGGRLKIWQPKRGYRGGTDPVFLAASCPVKPEQHVLDLGCGTGIASLCLLNREPTAKVTGFELNPFHIQLAFKSAQDNDSTFTAIEGDVASPPNALKEQSFDHVICNPPYFPANGGTSSRDQGKEIALRETVPLPQWVDLAIKRCSPKGSVTFIARTDRLADCLAAMHPRLGALVIKPLSSRHDSSAHRFILQGWKGRKTPLRLAAPLIVHTGTEHTVDKDSHSEDAQKILHDGHSLKL